MKTLNTLNTVLLYALILLPVMTGCEVLNFASLAGHAAGGKIEGKTFAYHYETDQSNASRIMDAYRMVGTELGWKLTTDSPEIIVWEVRSSNVAEDYFGKVNEASFYASVMPDYVDSTDIKTLRLAASITGNFNEATKEKVDQVVEDFTTRLADRLKENGHTLARKSE